MIVCVCHKVSDTRIKQIVTERDVKSLPELQQAIDVCQTCRKCTKCIRQILSAPQKSEAVN